MPLSLLVAALIPLGMITAVLALARIEVWLDSPYPAPDRPLSLDPVPPTRGPYSLSRPLDDTPDFAGRKVEGSVFYQG